MVFSSGSCRGAVISTRAFEPVSNKMAPLLNLKSSNSFSTCLSSTVLIDKDQSPKWNPPTLEEVSHQMVEQSFSSLGHKDLTF